MKLTVKRFRIRKGGGGPEGAAPKAAASAPQSPGDFAPTEDNLGEAPFETARGAGPVELAAIEAEGLTTRQLRLARRVAQRQGLQPASDFEAVRLLRLKGIDPFQRSRLMEMVRPAEAEAAPEAAAAPGQSLLPVDENRLPVHARGAGLLAQAGEAAVFADLAEIQRDLARRRRQRQRALALRLFLFIFLPTFIAGYYYARVATPLYATFAEFKIDAPDSPLAGGASALLRGTALATSQDAIAVQGYLQSREALQRLDAEEGFRAHFADPALDPLLRLPEGASAEELYALYRRQVKIAYDPTEGIIRLEVRAAEAESAARFSRALIRYAEAQVDQLTQRVREDQMKGARESMAEAEAKMAAAQQALVTLQQELKVLSSAAEVGLITGQIGTLEAQLSAEQLSLAQMRQNPAPNPARMAPVQQRIEALEAQIAALRARLTEGSAGTRSLAEVQSALLMAEAEVKTRELLLTQAVQALETARIEANRQVRYLLVSVHPVAPDAAAYPRVFENTLVAFLILAGIYLLLAMTAEILREQMSA